MSSKDVEAEVGERTRLTWDEALVSVGLIVMVILNFVGVVSRYWLKFSIPWIVEVLTGMFTWIVFIAAGLTVVRRMHVGFSIVVDRLPTAPSRVLRHLRLVGFAIFFGLLAWFGVIVLAAKVRSGETTPIGLPAWIWTAAVPAGSIVALWRTVWALVADLRADRADR